MLLYLKVFLIIVLVAAAIAYELLVRWHMKRDIATRYNAVVARFLDDDMVITFWRTIYLKHMRQVLKDQKLKHELFHINEQWAKWPRLFVFLYQLENGVNAMRYLWHTPRAQWSIAALKAYVYDKNKYENAARAAAGQPTR